MAKRRPNETKLKGIRSVETDWKSFTDGELRAAIRNEEHDFSTTRGTRDVTVEESRARASNRKMAAERELAMRHWLPDGTRLRVAPFEVDVEVNTSTGPHWAEVATFDEACSVLYHLAMEVAAGETIHDDVELPDGHDLRVREGVIVLRVRESWACGRWVQLAGDEESAELLALLADEAATGTVPGAGSMAGLVNAVAGALVAGPVGVLVGGLLGGLAGAGGSGEELDPERRDGGET